MKKILFPLLFVLVALSFQACSKDSDDNNSEWRQQNEEAFNEITKNSAYTSMTIPEGPGAIYIKSLKSGSGKTPITGQIVKVEYIGKYITGKAFDDKIGYPASFAVTDSRTGSGIIPGWMIALQNMKVGDKWEVWIPWNLAYGATGLIQNGTTVIPGYSTLIFEMELLEVTDK